MFPLSLLLLPAAAFLLQSVLALGVAPGQIKNWVVYGDSYTDITDHSDGGTPWPYYVVGYGKYKMFSIAHSGAVCSNALTYRIYPDIVTNEIPEYLAAKNSLGYAPAETIFTIWIGTNDMGVLVTGSGAPGVTYKNTTECATGWLETLYQNGARNFIFMNMVPLDHAPQYTSNATAVSFLRQNVANGNEYAKFLLRDYAFRLPDTHIALFDSNRLFQDIIDNPNSGALNGTMPPNVTGNIVGDCPQCSLSDRDSWMWQDGIHPSEQMDRLVARSMNLTMSGVGGGKYTEWFS